MPPFTDFHHGSRLQESGETPSVTKPVDSSTIALLVTAPDASDQAFPMHDPVLLLPSDKEKAAALGTTGTAKDAIDDVLDQVSSKLVIIRVPEGQSTTETQSNIVGDATRFEGVHALKKAQSKLGIKPRLVASPGFTAPEGTAANPVVAELAGVLNEIKAIGFVDGPDGSDADAVAYKANVPPSRCYLTEPKVAVWDTEINDYIMRPSSARFAGVQARVDSELGFWWSLSNKPLYGIGGISRPISYGDQSNYLNENAVNTIINRGNGFITWGNRLCTNDDIWSFISVRRTADFINEDLEETMFDYVDKPMSQANVKFMVEAGKSRMKYWGPKNIGAILGGDFSFPVEQNSEESLAAGRIRFKVDLEPVPPMEDIGVTAHRNLSYFLDLTTAVSAV